MSAVPAPRTAMDVAVTGWLTHVHVERGLSEHTRTAYRHDLARYLEFCSARGVTSPTAIDPALVSDFLLALRTGDEEHVPLAPSSSARTLAAVRSFHRFLIEEQIAQEDPTANVSAPALGMRLPKALQIDQVIALLDAAALGDTPTGLRDKALLELLYSSGLRVSEAVGLDVDDIPQGEDLLRVTGKGSKQRIVPVGGAAREALSNYLVRARPALMEKGTGTPALFLNARGSRLSRQSVWTIIQGAAKRANLGVDVSPHTLRHSCATHLLQGGADVRVVQEFLGHASVATTQIYTLVTIDTLREVHAQSHPRARW